MDHPGIWKQHLLHIKCQANYPTRLLYNDISTFHAPSCMDIYHSMLLELLLACSLSNKQKIFTIFFLAIKYFSFSLFNLNTMKISHKAQIYNLKFLYIIFLPNFWFLTQRDGLDFENHACGSADQFLYSRLSACFNLFRTLCWQYTLCYSPLMM